MATLPIHDYRDLIVATLRSGRSCIVVDTKLTWTPCRWLELYAGVNNVFDEEYAEYGLYDLYSTPARATSYPSPGRNFVAGFRLTAEF